MKGKIWFRVRRPGGWPPPHFPRCPRMVCTISLALSEWVEAPAGIVMQIMGHKPSAIAEKHYIQRELDLLHLWHVRIEAWILKRAGIEFVPVAQPGALRVVKR